METDPSFREYREYQEMEEGNEVELLPAETQRLGFWQRCGVRLLCLTLLCYFLPMLSFIPLAIFGGVQLPSPWDSGYNQGTPVQVAPPAKEMPSGRWYWNLPLASMVLIFFPLTERLKVNRTTTNLLRLLRLMRLLRLIRDIPPLHTLAVGILESLQGMTWVFLLALLVLYSCGIMCTQLIGHRLLVGEDCPQAVVDIFPHVGESMFVLFKVMNADAQVLDPLFEYMQISKMITAYFMILANWAILAILTAVVSENLINACAQHRKEQEDEKQIRNREKLTQIFEDMDESGSGDRNGKLSKSEFEAKIRTERHKLEESLIEAHIPSDVEHLRELFELRSKQPASDKEPQIELEDFVDCLHFQSKEVSQRTLMRMEGRIKSLQNLVFTLMGEEVDSPKRHGTSPRARARRGADSPGTL